MAAKEATDLDWSRRVATSVTESLLFPKLIGWKSFDAALDVAIDAVHSWLKKGDYPASPQGHDKVDHTWTEKVARSIVDALVAAKLVTETDSPRALENAQEEISINLTLGDPPPQQS